MKVGNLKRELRTNNHESTNVDDHPMLSAFQTPMYAITPRQGPQPKDSDPDEERKI